MGGFSYSVIILYIFNKVITSNCRINHTYEDKNKHNKHCISSNLKSFSLIENSQIHLLNMSLKFKNMIR